MSTFQHRMVGDYWAFANASCENVHGLLTNLITKSLVKLVA